MDPRESVAFHVFTHSVLSRTKAHVSFTPLCGDREDASNTFSKARFWVPEIMGYQGWAIFADGDMLCRADIAELWELRESYYDVMVVKHDYRTKYPTKYLGQKNEDYPRKNWSSLMLLHCGQASWRRPSFKKLFDGFAGPLHRFEFMDDERIGELPAAWNHLVAEYPYDPDAKLVHFTVGTPCWQAYATHDYADEWCEEFRRTTYFQPFPEPLAGEQ